MSDSTAPNDGKKKQHNNNMGDDGAVGEDEVEDEKPQQKLDKTSAQNAADMEKVTDISEEKEFWGGGNASAVSRGEEAILLINFFVIFSFLFK